MDKIRFTKSDAYIVLLFFIIAIPVTFFGYPEDTAWYIPYLETLIYVFFTCLAAYVTVYKIFPHFFPDHRLIILFIVTTIFMALCGIAEISCYRLTNQRNLDFLQSPLAIMWGISTSAQNAGILIGILLGKKFYDALLDIQKKDMEMKENELMLLKSQIDPHFLFNNLNTVDALIDSDPKVAKAYLNNLSRLYRYLIRTKDDEVVNLNDELEFGKNYIYLIEKRFGEAFKFELFIDENKITDQLIPPGALQAVLENVVKHNAANQETPLLTTIKIKDDYVVVENDKNLKVKKSESTKIGLNNLIARYKFLTDKEVQIEDGHKYSISLPIINTVD